MPEPDWLALVRQSRHVRLFARLYTGRLRGLVLSPRETEMLSVIVMAGEPVTPLWLSQRLGVGKSTASALIEGLTRAGYLEKTRDENDRRRYFLRVTETGLTRMKEACNTYIEPMRELRGALGPEDYQNLVELLAQANAVFQDGRPGQETEENERDAPGGDSLG